MLRKDWDDMANNGTPGDWFFEQENAYIVIRMGEDHMDVIELPISPTNPHAWQWDGNLEAPTLSPSIKILPNGWHGYLRNGKLETV